MAGKKISQLTALGGTYAATDLFEISKDMGGGTYASRKITGAELTSSIGAGTVTSVGGTGTVNGLTLTGTVTTSGNLTLGGTLAINNGDWSGTDLSVANGGTGASTLTANGVLIGNGTSAITAVDMSTKGDILIGDGTGNPQMLALGTDGHILTADSSEATGVKWAAAGGGGATDLNGLTDAEIVASSGGSALQYNIFLTNGTSAGAATQHGTLNDARANLAIGPSALAVLTDGDYNIAIGYQAGDAITTAAGNVCVGYAAGSAFSTTGSNVCVGYAAGHTNTGTGSTLIGTQTADGGSGDYNVCLGYDAGGTLAAGGHNVFVGANAGNAITSGGYNVMLGKNTDGAAAGIWQIAIGEGVATTQTKSMAIGRSGGILLHGEYATAGETSLGVNLGATWTAPSASLHVKGAATSNTTSALLVTDSSDNQLVKIINSGDSIFMGHEAGLNADAAAKSIYIGFDSGKLISTSGGSNVAIGYQALAGSAGNINSNVAIGYNAYKNAQAGGNQGVCIGYGAGDSITTGAKNICIGYDAGDNITTGENNIIIGYNVDASVAGADNELRIGNGTVIPISADLSAGGTGGEVTINGAYTLPNVVTAANDYVLTAQTDGTTAWAAASGGGASDLDGLSDCVTNATSMWLGSTSGSGNYNTALGIQALDAVAIATGYNTAVGYKAASAVNVAYGMNVAMGYEAMGNAHADSQYNTCVGTQAGQDMDTGNDYNSFFGYQTGKGSGTSSGSRNAAVGATALTAFSTGGFNSGIGYGALAAVTTGNGNTGLGYLCGNGITTGSYNTVIGYDSDVVADADKQIAIGFQVATTQASSLFLGTSGIGLLHGDFATAGATKLGINLGNTFSAPTATLHVKGTSSTDAILVQDDSGTQLMKLANAGSCVAIGKNANKDADTDANNIALGESALYTSDGGDDNFAAGYQSQYTLSDAIHNIAIGNSSLRTNSTGDYNICFGRHAGYALTGNGNVIIGGYNTGNAVAAGVYNTILGYQAGDTVTSGGYNIIIGYRADAAATVSNQIAIGDTTTVSGQYGIAIGDTITAAGDRFVFGRASNTMTNDFTTDNSWTQSSDIRKKQNINDANLGLSFINKLRTTTYQWRPAEEHPEEWKAYDIDDEGNKEYHKMDTETVMHGLIAQEVKEALDSEGCDTFAGWKEYEDGQQGISKEMIVYPIIKAVQELSAKVAELEAKLENK